MDRIWVKHYSKGVPAEIDANAYPSLAALLEESMTRYADRNALICMDKILTYREVDDYSAALGAYFQNLGLPRGARIAVMMPNVLQNPIAITAILRAGYVVVNVNPLYTPRELEHQLKDSGAEAIVVLENFCTTVQQTMGHTQIKHVIVAAMGDLMGFKGTIVNFVVRHVKKMVPAWSIPGAVSFNDALATGRQRRLQKVEIGPDDPAFLQYTGGTTGVAKGATLVHRNVVANTLQCDAWMRPGLEHGKPIDQICICMALPLYHIFALTAVMLLGMRLGGVLLMIPNPRDIPGFIKELGKYPVNMLPAVNTLFNALLNNPDFGKLDFSGLRIAVGGGMAVQSAVAERWVKTTGCPLAEGYGLSETSPVLTCNTSDLKAYTGTIGLPVPSTDISIRDDNGAEVALGQPGEICAKGPQVMPGYWNQPAETAKVMTADGFFRTGDIGVMSPDGFVRIVDRKKDMILVSGFNVYPNEVEDVIASHPGVLECAVVGVPDPHSTEAVKAFVVKRDPSLTAEELIAFCHKQLTNYKVPRHIEFRTELPKTNVGKILRRALRDEEPALAKAS